jgi:hypothetical protein
MGDYGQSDGGTMGSNNPGSYSNGYYDSDCKQFDKYNPVKSRNPRRRE